MVFVGVGFILLFWFADILIDAYLFREGTFLSQLLDPEPYEIYVRILIVVVSSQSIGAGLAGVRKMFC